MQEKFRDLFSDLQAAAVLSEGHVFPAVYCLQSGLQELQYSSCKLRLGEQTYVNFFFYIVSMNAS